MKNYRMPLTILSLVIAVFAFNSYTAAAGAPKAPAGLNVEQTKANMISHLDARIKLLQAQKTCVEAAKTKEDLKACRKAAKEERMKMREDIKAQKKGRGQRGPK